MGPGPVRSLGVNVIVGLVALGSLRRKGRSQQHLSKGREKSTIPGREKSTLPWIDASNWRIV
jgi:hypothetical protein